MHRHAHFCCSELQRRALAAACQASPISLHLATQVASGALVAGYNSEGTTGNDTAFKLFATGIVSPRVALFRKPSPTCTADEAAVEARVAAAEKAAAEKAAADAAEKASKDDDDRAMGLVITLAVLAVALLLTASVIVHLIRMVRPTPAPAPAPTRTRTRPRPRPHPHARARTRTPAPARPHPSHPPMTRRNLVEARKRRSGEIQSHLRSCCA